MNKTVTVNISGFVFYIEEDAYNVLSTYLNRIKSIFNREESADEIVEDVEARIAELFKESLGDNKEVVNMKDVEDVIQTMGKPEDFMEEGNFSAESESSTFSESTESSRDKKLYRDADERVIGGVCSGLSHYFGLDAVILRVIFVLVFLFGTAGGWIYIILWIVMPKAESTAEKLRMKGERVTVESIKKKVNDLAQEDNLNKAKSGAQKLFDGLGEVLTGAIKVIGKIISILLAIFFGILGVALLIGFGTILFTPDSAVNMSFTELEWHEVKDLVFHGSYTFYLLVLGIALLFISPIVGLFYLSIRLISGGKYKSRGLVSSVLISFLIGIIITIIGSVSLGNQYSAQGDTEENIVYTGSSDHIHVMLSEDDIFHSRIKWDSHHENNLDLMKIDGSYLYNGALIDIRTKSTLDSNLKVNITRESQGPRGIKSIEFAENMNYEFGFDGDTLMLAPYFSSPLEDGFRCQRIEITVFIPEGKSVSFDDNTRRIETSGIKPGRTYSYNENGRKIKEGSDSFIEDEKSGHHKITIEQKQGKTKIDIEKDIEIDIEEGNESEEESNNLEISI